MEDEVAPVATTQDGRWKSTKTKKKRTYRSDQRRNALAKSMNIENNSTLQTKNRCGALDEEVNEVEVN